jgi:hypothetical protein
MRKLSYEENEVMWVGSLVLCTLSNSFWLNETANFYPKLQLVFVELAPAW